MKLQILAALSLLGLITGCTSKSSVAPSAGAIGFDKGEMQGWVVESTGGSGPVASWNVQADKHAVSAPNVLSMTAANHDDDSRFNLRWNRELKFGDGRISVAMRADGGEVDQGGGPMWRVQDANNYYICRVNPLEANFRVYVVKGGVRKQLATAMIETQAGDWHRLEVEHEGDRIRCSVDGKLLLEATDSSLPASGGVGLWTKADALTSFDDLLVLTKAIPR
jgi:hypothetical protein